MTRLSFGDLMRELTKLYDKKSQDITKNPN